MTTMTRIQEAVLAHDVRDAKNNILTVTFDDSRNKTTPPRMSATKSSYIPSIKFE